MIEGWSHLSSVEYNNLYASACIDAVNSDEAFKTFKRDHRYNQVLEHVPTDQGQVYADQIVAQGLDSELLKLFKENDYLGGASLHNYNQPFGFISPSTLRYIKNTLDIKDFVGGTNLGKVVEIGGGYGGLCKTLSCACEFSEYHLYDIEPASKLQQKYLSNFEIDAELHYRSSIDVVQDIDLVISNYAYSELNEELQTLYYNNVIANSKRVYMILNKGQVDREVLLNRAEKDFTVTVGKVLDFYPANGHLYYTTMVRDV